MYFPFLTRWMVCFFFFIGGVLTGSRCSSSVYGVFLPAILATFLLLVMLAVYRKAGSIFFGILVFCAFYLLGWIWVSPYAKFPDRFLRKESNITFRVTSVPSENYLYSTFYARTLELNGNPVYLKIKVKDYARYPLKLWDKVAVRGEVKSGRFAPRLYTVSLTKKSRIKRIPLSFLERHIQNVASAVLEYFQHNLSEEAYRFLAAVFLGRREMVNYATKKVFVKAGVAHLMAISGLHVGILGMIIFTILKLVRLKFRVRLMFSVIVLFLYTVVTGMAPSTLRAVCMYTIFAGSFFLRRRVNIFDILGLAGIVCLLINSLWVYDVGFILSFLSVGGIVLGFRMFPLRKRGKHSWWRGIKKVVLSTIFATISIGAVISYYFGKIYFVSVLSNIVLVPLFGLIILMAAMMVVGMPVPLWTYLLGPLVSLVVSYFIKITTYLASWRLPYLSCSFSLGGMVAYYTVLIILIGIVNFLRYNKLREAY